MNRRLIALPVIAMSLLSSCSQRPLRSDIQEFVASFSLSKSKEQYKNAGYTSVKTTTIDNQVTSEIEELKFNINDLENPVYSLKTTTKKGEEITKISENFLKVEDGVIYYVQGENTPVPYSATDVQNLVEKFFYQTTMYDGAYHARGMYYGDYLLEIARELQDFMEIDQENELLVFTSDQEGKMDGNDAKLYQKYSVNKLGMLVENQVFQKNGNNTVDQKITVFKL